VESRQFHHAIDTLGPHADELDDKGLVTLALALESIGRQADAIDLLKKAQSKGTDPLGVLAGRLKRRWLVEQRRKDAEQASALYHEGLAQAEAKGDASQAYYHAINCAFMALAFEGNMTACRDYASRALTYCASRSPGIWRYATEGEAHIYLGDHTAVRDAVRAGPGVRAYAATNRVDVSAGLPCRRSDGRRSARLRVAHYVRPLAHCRPRLTCVNQRSAGVRSR
jgi:tetratricopeptide (TPR) repeat protein